MKTVGIGIGLWVIALSLWWGFCTVFIGSPEPVSVSEGGADDMCPSGMIKKLGASMILCVIVLCVMGLYAIAISIDRLVAYFGAIRETRRCAPELFSALMNRRFDDIISICAKYPQSHLATVIGLGVCSFLSTNHQPSIRKNHWKPPKSGCSG